MRFPPRLNSDIYLNFLVNELPQYLEDVELNVRPNLIYQHDGAPCHYGRNVTNWLNLNYENRWIGRNGPIHWPARSPDLTILDFYVWGTMKEIVYSVPILTLEQLNLRIDEAANQIREQLRHMDVSQAILRRALACIRNRGSHFEQFL